MDSGGLDETLRVGLLLPSPAVSGNRSTDGFVETGAERRYRRVDPELEDRLLRPGAKAETSPDRASYLVYREFLHFERPPGVTPELDELLRDSGVHRVYRQLSSPEISKPHNQDIRGDLLLGAWWDVLAEGLEAFDDWYDHEHIPMLMAVPRWLRIRRFELVRGPGPRYLALHDIGAESSFDEPGHRAAGRTPWRGRATVWRRNFDVRLYRVSPARVDRAQQSRER